MRNPLRAVLRSEAEHHLFVRMPPERADGEAAAQPLRAGQDYFQLTLCEMFLANDREWSTKRVPVVHSLVQIRHGRETIELPYIAGPLDIQAVSVNNLNKVVRLNYPLTGLLPYNGGQIELAAGLLALDGGDVVARVVGVLSSFAALLQVPALSTGLAVAKPLVEGIRGLVGSGDDVALGLHQTFGGAASAATPRYFAALLAPGHEVRPEHLRVEDDQLRVGGPGEAPVALKGVTYMLFRLDRSPTRVDWEGITALVGPFDRATAMLLEGDAPERADALVRAAAVAVMQSPDLTLADRLSVMEKLKERYDRVKQIPFGAAPSEELPPAATVFAEAPPLGRTVTELDLELSYQELFR